MPRDKHKGLSDEILNPGIKLELKMHAISYLQSEMS